MEYHAPTRPDTLVLASGRTLAWAVYGGPLKAAEAAATPAVVFYFHGFPGSRCEASFLQPALLQKYNARCVAIDRPGMGQSTHYAERRLLDWPRDVLAVADHLGIEEFYIVAVSGGVPYGLACAKEIPRVDSSAATDPSSPKKGRLRGVALLAGAYHFSLGTEDMLPPVRMILTAGAWLPRAITGALFDWQMGSAARNEDPTVLEKLVDKEMSGRPEFELRVYRQERVRQVAIESMRESFCQGAQGVATDLMLLCTDWGFGFEDVNTAGLSLWHGKLDQNVPFAVAQKAAALMPGIRTHFIDDVGHLGLPVTVVEDVFAELLPSVAPK